MTSYRQVNSVIRAFGLLEIMNRQKFTSVDVLHKMSGLPKSTIVRLLETLAGAGYVVKDAAGKGYRVTSAVNALSCGYHGAPLVVEAARPWAQTLTVQLRWPVAIAVLDENAALVAYTTCADSPMSPYQGILHHRLGLLSKALGRAYLAFCPLKERRLILDILARAPHPDSHIDSSEGEVESMLDAVARQGFAARGPSGERTPSSSLAVPIFELGSPRVLGTIGITYYSSAVRWEQAVERYVPLLQSAAKGIGQSVAVLQHRVLPEPGGAIQNAPQRESLRA
ncbi:DNA-binding transcriptional regulator [Aquabacter spiritensis]|uniref:IclR family transcriptional regulator n=1 Tax=Aquabacter spiritensis TaxID=933073 RepID=A0A4R3LSU4_9HYPH|nr:DNA-binding transcriptional regulator [Aquabacter spiritensis]TCT03590.1 IclR family transcriptional regulator [Aquabacter spiritensis]